MDSGMFLPMQKAAIQALSVDSSWYENQNAIYSERREKVFELLDVLNCHYKKDQAGLFVWAAIPKCYQDGYSLCDEILHQANVFITPGAIFGTAGEQYIRISLCNEVKVIDLAIKRIKNSLPNLKQEKKR